MKRLIAAAAGVALAAALAGCTDGPKPNAKSATMPDASDLFDKKEVPEDPAPPKKSTAG